MPFSPPPSMCLSVSRPLCLSQQCSIKLLWIRENTYDLTFKKKLLVMLFFRPCGSKQHLPAECLTSAAYESKKGAVLVQNLAVDILYCCNIKSSSLFLLLYSSNLESVSFFFSSLPALCKLCLWKSAIQIKLSLSPPTLKSPLTRLKHISSLLKATRRLERQIAHKAHKHSSPGPP